MQSRSVAAVMASALTLLIPATASADYAHVVAPGETLTSVAAMDGLTVSALAAANGLSPQAELIAGSILQIPPQTAYTQAGSPAVAETSESPGVAESSESAGTPAPVSTSSSPAAATGGYVVQPGDTLTAIAGRDGTSVAELAALNGLNPAGILYAGSTLTLPAPGASAPASTTQYVSTSSTGTTSPAAAAEGQPVGTAALTGSGNGPYPTPETVSGSEIAGIAASTGTPSALAQAIGWQESGWNNDLVSPTGAVGVMQIEPGTWDWIQRTLTAGTSLSPYSAADNVRGGALLLHSLLAATGSDSMAAAAYYQGLSSVQQNGMFPDTQQYVGNVMALESRFASGG